MKEKRWNCSTFGSCYWLSVQIDALFSTLHLRRPCRLSSTDKFFVIVQENNLSLVLMVCFFVLLHGQASLHLFSEALLAFYFIVDMEQLQLHSLKRLNLWCFLIAHIFFSEFIGGEMVLWKMQSTDGVQTWKVFKTLL